MAPSNSLRSLLIYSFILFNCCFLTNQQTNDNRDRLNNTISNANAWREDPLELDPTWEMAIRMVMLGNWTDNGQEEDNSTLADTSLKPTFSDFNATKSSKKLEELEDDEDEDYDDKNIWKQTSPSIQRETQISKLNSIESNPALSKEEEEVEENEQERLTDDQMLTNVLSNFIAENPLVNLNASSDTRQVWRRIVGTFQAQLSRLLKAMTPSIMDIFYQAEDLSGECSSALVKLINAAQADEIWALEILQSNGQLPVGFFSGTISSLGDYDQCLGAAENTTDKPLVGKYCLLEVSLPTLPAMTNGSLLLETSRRMDILPPEVNYQFRSKLAMLHSAFYSANLTIGVCMPSTCSGSEITNLARLMIGQGIKLSVGNCQTKSTIQTKRNLKASWNSLDTFQQVSIAFLVVSFTATLVASLADCSRSSSTKKCLELWIDCFSLIRNFDQLAKAGEKKPEQASLDNPSQISGRLDFISGLRVLSMLWVVTCHVFALGCLTIPQLLYRIEEEARPFAFRLINQIFYNGLASVENFFFLSGFLLAHSHLSKKRTAPTLLEHTFRRYVQLAFPMAALIAIYFLWFGLMSDGPMFGKIASGLINSCRQNWWKNLVLINNFDRLDELCLLHTWFLSSDFQMHLLAYPMVWALSTTQPLISTLTFGLVFGSLALVLPGYLTYQQRIPPTLNPMNEARIDDYFNHLLSIYYPFYNHWISYLVGFLLSTWLHYRSSKIRKQSKATFSQPISWFWLCSITVVALGVSLSMIFAGYFWAGDERQLDDNRLLINAMYRALYPLMFVVGIAWISALCILHPRNIIDRFLSLPMFVRLSPLTGSIYLVHLPIVWFLILRSRQPIRATYVDFINMLGGTLIYSLPLAFLFQLVLIMPYMKFAFEVKVRLARGLLTGNRKEDSTKL